MRILLVGVAAVALSGCSWLSGGYSYNNNHGGYSYGDQGSYNTAPAPRKAKSLSKWSMHGAIGTDFIVGGDAITGNDTNGAVNVHQVAMKDMYDIGYRAEGGLQYKLNGKQSLTLSGHYQEATGKDNVTFANNGPQNVPANIATMTMSDYKAYGFEAGLRHDLAKERMPLLRSVQPYLEGRLGISKTNDLTGTNVVVGGAAAPNINLYEGRLVPTASALVGVEKPLGSHLSIGVESGIRYIGESNPDDSTTGGTIFAEMNNGSSRWSVPVQLRARYRF